MAGKKAKIMFSVMSFTSIVGRIFNMQIEAGIKSVHQSACKFFNFFLASGDICCLLITFANSLGPDQNGHAVGPDLDPNSLAL